MATVKHYFKPDEAHFLNTAFAVGLKVNGTNFPVYVLAFDAATDEEGYWRFIANNYGSGNLTLNIFWTADTASTGDVIWGGHIGAITPETDSQAITTNAFATAQTVTDSHLGTTVRRIMKATLTISNLDSLAADDWVDLRVYRDADAAGDTMAGDAWLLGLELTYSDT